MIALGAFVGPGRIAASLARDGAVLAAELSLPAGEGALAGLALQCLEHAGVPAHDVDEIALCQTGHTADAVLSDAGGREALARAFPRARLKACSTAQAHLELIRSLSPAERAVVVLDGAGDGGSFGLLRDRLVARAASIEGCTGVGWALSTAADALGWRTGDPIAFLEQASAGADAPAGDGPWISSTPRLAIEANRDRLLNDVVRFQEESRQATPAAAAQSRQRLATSILENIADVVASLSRAWMLETGAGAVTLAGGLFATHEFRSRVERRLESVDWLATPSDALAAIGASLGPFGTTIPLETLALGASFDEQAVKLVIENCRLDYVYEPQWGRLLDSVSRLLSSGSLVAWFQGRGDFGEVSFGSRSILADPTSAYARENVNLFLLRRPAHAPLALATSSDLADPKRSDGVPVEVPVVPAAEWFAQVRAVVDRRGAVRLTRGRIAPGLQELLEAHARRTGVAALINVPLCGQSSPLANSPRSAIQSLFGSATDCLVIGRFIVAKDYWLLRNRTR